MIKLILGFVIGITMFYAMEYYQPNPHQLLEDDGQKHEYTIGELLEMRDDWRWEWRQEHLDGNYCGNYEIEYCAKNGYYPR